MDLDLRIGNCDTGFVEGEFDIFCQCEFGGEIVSGFRPGANCQIHAVVGQFKHPTSGGFSSSIRSSLASTVSMTCLALARLSS